MSANNFFLAKHFAVAGASTNPSKFGYKVLAWYKQHDLPVTPINPVFYASNLMTNIEI